MMKKSVYIKMYITLLLIAFTIMVLSTNMFGKGIPFQIEFEVGGIKFAIITISSLIGLLLLVSVLMGYIFALKRASKSTDIALTYTSAINIFDYLSVFVLAALIVYLGFIFIAYPVTVTQSSMTPTCLDGDRLLVLSNKGEIKREDIVVFKIDSSKLNVSSFYDDELWLKRVIGLPGEKIEFIDGVLYVNGEKYYESYLYDENGDFLNGIVPSGSYDCKLDTNRKVCKNLSDVLALTGLSGDTIPEGYYLLLGDNRVNSYDSWSIGLVPEELIVGKAKWRIENFITYKKIQ